MKNKFKCVITELDENGNSIILSETYPEATWVIPDAPAGEHLLTRLWSTKTSPADPLSKYDQSEPLSLIQSPGCSQFIIEVIPPLKHIISHLESIGKPITDVKKYNTHRTDSVDYVIVLAGEVTLIVSDKEIKLTTGDCIVQRATVHSWQNHTDEPCVIGGVILSTKQPSVIKDKPFEPFAFPNK